MYDVGCPIIKDREGIIWMGSLNGLSSFDQKTKQFNIYNYSESDPGTISDNHITAMIEDMNK